MHSARLNRVAKQIDALSPKKMGALSPQQLARFHALVDAHDPQLREWLTRIRTRLQRDGQADGVKMTDRLLERMRTSPGDEP